MSARTLEIRHAEAHQHVRRRELEHHRHALLQRDLAGRVVEALRDDLDHPLGGARERAQPSASAPRRTIARAGERGAVRSTLHRVTLLHRQLGDLVFRPLRARRRRSRKPSPLYGCAGSHGSGVALGLRARAPAAERSATSPSGARCARSSGGAPGGCGRRTRSRSRYGISSSIAFAPSRVAQSHCGSRSKSGRCVRTTMRASFGCFARSAASHASCSSPICAPRVGHVVDDDEVHALVVEGVVRLAEELLERLAVVERRVVLARHEAHVLDLEVGDDVLELGAGACGARCGSSVVCVRSPVNTMKSGGCDSALTAATAFCSVPWRRGWAGPRSPSGCRTAARSRSRRRLPAAGPPQHRARPDANTTPPPTPASFRKSLRSIAFHGSLLVEPEGLYRA